MKQILLALLLLSAISGCSLTSMFSTNHGLPQLTEPAITDSGEF